MVVGGTTFNMLVKMFSIVYRRSKQWLKDLAKLGRK